MLDLTILESVEMEGRPLHELYETLSDKQLGIYDWTRLYVQPLVMAHYLDSRLQRLTISNKGRQHLAMLRASSREPNEADVDYNYTLNVTSIIYQLNDPELCEQGHAIYSRWLDTNRWSVVSETVVVLDGRIVFAVVLRRRVAS